ncbi:MAG: efflux transporter outer membrane subunit [Pseudomonadota bacterium]
MNPAAALYRLNLAASTALGVVLLAGCSVGPNFVRPDNAVHSLQQNDVAAIAEQSVPAEWWRLFNDELLIELESRAMAGNLDLQIASERIEQSRSQLGIASADLLPTLAASSSYAREALSENGKFAALGAPSTASNFWQLGFDASWELDLWGRANRSREGAIASLEATLYERQAARVSLSAEVARTYLQLRGIQSQLDIAEQNLKLAEHLVNLAESRERNGVATRFETASARAQLATINASVPELLRRRNDLTNALALLLGEQPRALDAQLHESMPLPSLPINVPTDVDSELARKRPDILRAEARLHAATAAIGVAKADFYPRIGLRGRIGVEAFESGDLDTWNSRFFTVGPTVYLPIFQGGRLMQRLSLNEARQREAAISYRQTVLRAWHEVNNALDAWTAQQDQHADLQLAHEQSQQAMHIAERGYQEGATDYLSVLTAQRSLLASQASLNASATNATLAMVNLYKSLAGDWNGDAP